MTEAERLRSLARSNEAAALRHAREEERAKWEPEIMSLREERAKWEPEVMSLREERAKWEPEIMSLREEVAKLRAQLEEKL